MTRKWIPAFAGMTGSKGVIVMPASAGMTGKAIVIPANAGIHGGTFRGSGAVSIDPPRKRWRRHRLHTRNQRTRIRIHHEQIPILLPDEPLQHGVIEKAQQRREKLIHIEQAIRLPVQPQLSPRPYLEQFLERSQPTGHGEKAIRQLREQRLPFVH